MNRRYHIVRSFHGRTLPLKIKAPMFGKVFFFYWFTWYEFLNGRWHLSVIWRRKKKNIISFCIEEILKRNVNFLFHQLPYYFQRVRIKSTIATSRNYMVEILTVHTYQIAQDVSNIKIQSDLLRKISPNWSPLLSTAAFWFLQMSSFVGRSIQIFHR